MKIFVTMALIGMIVSASMHANEMPNGAIRQEHIQLMEKRKGLESQSHQERIKILQQAEECIKNATTPKAYKECEEKEQAARKAFKEQQKPAKEELKKEYQELKQKALEAREERIKNREIKKGVIETH